MVLVEPEQIRVIVEVVRRQFVGRPIREFVPIVVEREVREHSASHVGPGRLGDVSQHV